MRCKCCIVYRGSYILDSTQTSPEVWVKKQVTLKLNQFSSINLLSDGRSSALPMYHLYAAAPAVVRSDAGKVEVLQVGKYKQSLNSALLLQLSLKAKSKLISYGKIHKYAFIMPSSLTPRCPLATLIIFCFSVRLIILIFVEYRLKDDS